MSYTRQDFARAFLASLGNNNPTQATVDWVVGWSVHETATGQGATYNLLNTTQRAPGSTSFNSVGVQNFTSFSQGVQTNAVVLGQNFNGYSALKQALVTNNIAALSGPSSGVQAGLKTWCGGCGYGVGFQALGAAHRNDSFSGTPTGMSGGAPSSSAPVQPPGTKTAATSTTPATSTPGTTITEAAGCTAPSNPLDVGGGISYAFCQAKSTFVSFGEHIAVFIIGLLLVIGGIYLIGHKQIDAAVGKVGNGAAKAGEAAAL